MDWIFPKVIVSKQRPKKQLARFYAIYLDALLAWEQVIGVPSRSPLRLAGGLTNRWYYRFGRIGLTNRNLRSNATTMLLCDSTPKNKSAVAAGLAFERIRIALAPLSLA